LKVKVNIVINNYIFQFLNLGEGSLVRTPRGFIQLKALVPSITKSREYEGMNLLATDIGSRIGVMYVPTSETKADMHFIINGEDQGPCARDIPYQVNPLYAVVDVYGSTKKVRVIQLNEGLLSLFLISQLLNLKLELLKTYFNSISCYFQASRYSPCAGT